MAIYDHDRVELIRDRMFHMRPTLDADVMFLVDEVERLGAELESMREHARGLAHLVSHCRRHHSPEAP